MDFYPYDWLCWWIINCWKSDMFDDLEVEYGTFSLLVNLKDKQQGNLWWITCIYGPSTNTGKRSFGQNKRHCNLIDGPWCIRGDFNEILFSSDRNGDSRINRYTQCFHDWISEFSLIDLPLMNVQHTWSNFRKNTSCSKIDRFFISKE